MRSVPPEAARAALHAPASAGDAPPAGRPSPMALIAFKPTKARLVLADGSDSMLVMKVTAAPGESVTLAAGGTLEALAGSLRVRERRIASSRHKGRTNVGTLLFVPGSAKGGADAAAKFQIDVSLEARKFAALLDVALAGGLPSKFFVEAGERLSLTRTRGIGYALVNGTRVKIWDNRAHRMLPVSGFTMILPIAVPPAAAVPAQVEDEPPAVTSLATNAQLAELADELLVFQSETRHTLLAIGGIVAVIIVLLLVATVVLMLR
jgi:hypothetical protein